MTKSIYTLLFPFILLYNWIISLYYIMKIEWVKYKFSVNKANWKIIFKSKK